MAQESTYKIPLWWQQYAQYNPSGISWSSNIQGPFWISLEGSTNPKLELQASVKLFEKVGDDRQCDFPYRGKLLLKQGLISELNLNHCEKMKKWKRDVGATEVALIFAESDLTSPGSSFGHTFLKFLNPINNGVKKDLNYTINFAAYTGKDTSAMIVLKGLFGYYQGYFSMLPFHEKMREYQNLEGRDIYEFKLNLSQEEVDDLLDLILDYEKNSFKYQFHSENCSFQILNLFQVIRENPIYSRYQVFDEVIPEETVGWFFKNNYILSQRWIPSLKSEWRTRYNVLSDSQKKISYQILNMSEGIKLISKLERSEQRNILDFLMSFQSFQDYKNSIYSKDKQFYWQNYRSTLGVSEPKKEGTKVYVPQMTSSWNFSWKSTDLISLGWQRSHHTLLQSQDENWSELIMLAPNIDYDIRIREATWRATLLKAANYKICTEFEKPLSWELDLGLSDKLRSSFGAGYGIQFFDKLSFITTTGLELENFTLRSGKIYLSLLGLLTINHQNFTELKIKANENLEKNLYFDSSFSLVHEVTKKNKILFQISSHTEEKMTFGNNLIYGFLISWK